MTIDEQLRYATIGSYAALDTFADLLRESATELAVDPDDKWLSLNDVIYLIEGARSSITREQVKEA